MTATLAPRTSSTPDGYQPVSPFSATHTTVLSQDTVMSATVPVDPESLTPVGPFTNPSNNCVEALVISNSQLGHACRNSSNEGGWSLNLLFNGVRAVEVAAGTAYAHTADASVYGLYTDESALYSTQLQPTGTDWSSPAQLTASAPTHLRTTYSVAGRMVVHGQTQSGDLVVAYQPTLQAAFITQTYSMPNPLADGNYSLCLTNENSWMLAAKANGQLWIYTGYLDGTSDQPATAGVATNYDGAIKQVVFGYKGQQQRAPIFLFVDSTGALQVWASNTGTVAPVPTLNTNIAIASVAAHVYVDPDGDDSIHVYATDLDMNLAVLHQDLILPWNMDGTPNWAAFMPLDTQIASVVIDPSPADVPSVFALSGDTYSLRLHTQDPTTRMWSTGEVLQSSEKAWEVVRYRVEVNMLDGAGRALCGYPVSISVAQNNSAVDLAVGGQSYTVSSTQSANVTTDSSGKLTLAMLATRGLGASQLVISADMLPTPLTVQPAEGVHTYLSGTGVLNPTNPASPANGSGPLPAFDLAGTTLQNAQVNGHGLAPLVATNDQLAGVAAAAIQQTAMVGLNQTLPGVAGFELNLADPQHPVFKVHGFDADLQARMIALQMSAPGDWWSDASDFFSDIWQGIQNGVMSIVNVVADYATQVMQFTLQVSGQILSGIQIALQGVEQAAHFIAGVFQTIGAEIEDLIDWLKALFDFGAIWRTKQAFEVLLVQAPAYIVGATQLGKKASQTWFTDQESQVNAAFQAAIKKYNGQTFGSLPNFQPSGSPPNNTTPVAGGATPADFTNNVHHNWLQDKVSACCASSTLGIQTNQALYKSWTDFASGIEGTYQAFLNALSDLVTGMLDILQDPNNLGNISITYLLNAMQGLVDGLLKFCDGSLASFMDLAAAAMDALATVLTTPIQVEGLNELWSWIAQQAGDSQDQLTIAAFVSLLAAFPATVIYKLVAGVNAEPFPPALERVGNIVNEGTLLAAAILQTLYAIPASAADILGPDCPTWLSVAKVGLSIIIWVLANGYPDLSAVEWVVAAVVAANLVWLAPTVYFVVQSLKTALPKALQDASFGDVSSALTSAYGGGKFLADIVVDFLKTPGPAEIVSGLLVPLPSLLSFLNMSQFREDERVKTVAIGTKVASDLIGYVGGGIPLVIDAASNLNTPALAQGS